MSERQTGQMSLADALVRQREGLNKRLERMGSLIDWGRVEASLAPLRRSRLGAPGYSPLVLFKALLLAQWYGLSDERLEEELADRVTFRRFVGLGLADETPDHTTLWRFREALGAAGLQTAAFAEINRQFDRRGLILRQGTLIDATLVEAQAARPSPPREQEAPPPGERPPSKLVRSAADRDADWTRRGGRRHFGYKGHIAVDQGSGLIRQQTMTPASINETSVADTLYLGDERAIYADKAYDSYARRARLRRLGLKNRIQRRGNQYHPPTAREILRNVLIGRVRGRIESIFGFFKRVWHYRRVRYFNLRRNAVQFTLMCTAYNIHRALRLV
jgi:IS5 family transposase